MLQTVERCPRAHLAHGPALVGAVNCRPLRHARVARHGSQKIGCVVRVFVPWVAVADLEHVRRVGYTLIERPLFRFRGARQTAREEFVDPASIEVGLAVATVLVLNGDQLIQNGARRVFRVPYLASVERLLAVGGSEKALHQRISLK